MRPLSKRFSLPRRQHAVVMCVAMALAPALLSAQSLRQQTAYSVDGPQQVLSANPFLPLFGNFQLEYERVINPNVTFAFAGSLTEWDDDRYSNIDAKLRLYPQENALRGVGLAASVGLGGIRRAGLQDCPQDSPCTFTPNTTVRGPTFAVEGSYQWLLGTRNATAITAGFGAKRYFVGQDELRDRSRVRPTGRLSIGYAF